MSNRSVHSMITRSKSTTIANADAKSKVSPIENHTTRRRFRRQIDREYSLDDSMKKHEDTCQVEHTSQDFKPSTRAFGKTISFPSVQQADVSRYPLPLDPGSPVILSPTDSISAASSPGVEDDVWGSPETPFLQPGRTSAAEVLTPLTPPTTFDRHTEQSPVPKAIKSLRTKAVTTAAATVPAASRSIASVDIKKEDLEADDYFQPKKLIRNLTKQLQAIADANAAAAQENYRLEPNFNFGSPHQSSKYTPSTKPKAQTRYNPKPDNSKPLLDIQDSDTKPNINVVPQVPIFSKELKVLEHIVPFNIVARLQNLPGKCVASLVKNPEERCTKNGPAQSTDMIFRKISRCNIETDSTELLSGIEALVHAVQCGRHRNVALSQPRMKKLTSIISNLPQLSKKDQSDFRAWVEAISNRSRASEVQDIPKQELPVDETPLRSKVPDSRSSPSTPSASLKSGTPIPSVSPKFLSYQPEWSKGLSESSALRKVITEPLNSTDLKRGFIYVFWDKEHFGKVKIGRTDNLERRLKQWNKTCRRTHEYHPSTKRELIEIPHHSRIERLIHIELKQRRMQRSCKECNRTHKEWFDVEETLAVKVFLKWRDWILQEPYALNPHTGKWAIRPEMESTLEAVCQPVLPPKPQPLPKGGKKDRRTSKRLSTNRSRKTI